MLAVDRVGPHELELSVGDERSVLPFRVLVPTSPTWEVVVYWALGCAGASMIVALVAAATRRRGIGAVFAGGFVIATTVALTAGVLSPLFEQTRPEGAPPAPDPAPMAARPNAQMAVEDDASPDVILASDPVAGRPVGIELDTGAGDVQPWLGMAGHLIVRSDDGGLLGHVHEQDSMAATGRPGGGADGSAADPPDESVAAYGPRLRFTFSFPEPGRYLAWIQYARNYEIRTVPYVIDAAAEGTHE